MKYYILILLFLIITGCTLLDNSGVHKPIYLTDERYAHYRQPGPGDIAPWPDCPLANERLLDYCQRYGY